MTYVVSLMSLPYGRVIKNTTRHTQEPLGARLKLKKNMTITKKAHVKNRAAIINCQKGLGVSEIIISFLSIIQI